MTADGIVEVTAVGTDVADVFVYDFFVLVRKTDGTLWIWGHGLTAVAASWLAEYPTPSAEALQCKRCS